MKTSKKLCILLITICLIFPMSQNVSPIISAIASWKIIAEILEANTTSVPDQHRIYLTIRVIESVPLQNTTKNIEKNTVLQVELWENKTELKPGDIVLAILNYQFSEHGKWYWVSPLHSEIKKWKITAEILEVNITFVPDLQRIYLTIRVIESMTLENTTVNIDKSTVLRVELRKNKTELRPGDIVLAILNCLYGGCMEWYWITLTPLEIRKWKVTAEILEVNTTFVPDLQRIYLTIRVIKSMPLEDTTINIEKNTVLRIELRENKTELKPGDMVLAILNCIYDGRMQWYWLENIQKIAKEEKIYFTNYALPYTICTIILILIVTAIILFWLGVRKRI